MRDILFKGKRLDNGEWVEGNLIFPENFKRSEAFIIPIKFGNIYVQLKEGDLGFRYWYKVQKETLCQFTGLTDKNGKKIWENDIVFVTDENDCSGQISTGIGDVIFIEGMWYIDGRPQEVLYDINKVFQIEVIGNALDNQELLQEES